ncbi:MAG: hypothetical protein ACI4U0_02665 [Candidatus Aphodocola sp.]
MKETKGIVLNVKSKGLDNPTIATVEFKVKKETYQIKETIKLINKTIKFLFIPIGQKKVPVINLTKGQEVIVVYDAKNPKKAHIKGNDGKVNC